MLRVTGSNNHFNLQWIQKFLKQCYLMKSDVLMLLVWSKKLLTVLMRFFTTKKPNLTATTNKFNNRGPSSQSYDFSSSHVWMWELDHKEGWAPKNWCFWTVVLEKTLKSPLDCKEIQPIHPKGNQSWMLIGRTDAEAETPIFGHLMRRVDSLEKTLMLGGIEGGRRRGHRGWDGWMASPIWWTWVWVTPGVGDG